MTDWTLKEILEAIRRELLKRKEQQDAKTMPNAGKDASGDKKSPKDCHCSHELEKDEKRRGSNCHRNSSDQYDLI